MKVSLWFLIMLFVLPALKAQAQNQRPCGGAYIDWKQSEQKGDDSSLNGSYYYPAGAETFARSFEGLTSYVVAIDVETKGNIAGLCQVVESQQVQLEALKAEVSALRKQVAAISRKDSASAPKK